MNTTAVLWRLTTVLGLAAICTLAACASASSSHGYGDADAGEMDDMEPAATDGGHAHYADAAYPTCPPAEPDCNAPAVPDAGVDAADGAIPPTEERDADAGPSGDPKACGLSNTCAGAISAGAISGDTATESITVQGSDSRWISVRVREDSLGDGDTKFTASLVSPEGANYDLRVYMNTNDDLVECIAESTNSELPAGSVDTVSMSWGHAFYDDSRTVNIEVVHTSGSCSSAQWTLLIEGDR